MWIQGVGSKTTSNARGYAITVHPYMCMLRTDYPTKMEIEVPSPGHDAEAHGRAGTRLRMAATGRSAAISTSRTPPLDIKIAKANEKHAGFLPEERAYVDKWLDE